METGQGPLVVRLVEVFFPPACREDVVGDLADGFIGAAAAAAAALELALATGRSPFALPSAIVGAGCALMFPVLAYLRVALPGRDSSPMATTGGGTADSAALRRQSELWWDVFWTAGILYAVTLLLTLSGPVPSGLRWAALSLAIAAGFAMRAWGRPPCSSGSQTAMHVAREIEFLERRRDHLRYWPMRTSYLLAAFCGFPILGYVLIRATDAVFHIDAPTPMFDLTIAWPVWIPVAGISIAWCLVGTAIARRATRAFRDEINALQHRRHGE